MNLQTTTNLPTGTVITLKEITDLVSVQHSKAMKKVLELSKEEGFGAVSQMDIVYNEQSQTIKTLALTKKQALAAGARLNNRLLMMVINRLEELEKGTNKPLTQLEVMMQSLEYHKKQELINEQTSKELITLRTDVTSLTDKIKPQEHRPPVTYKSQSELVRLGIHKTVVKYIADKYGHKIDSMEGTKVLDNGQSVNFISYDKRAFFKRANKVAKQCVKTGATWKHPKIAAGFRWVIK